MSQGAKVARGSQPGFGYLAPGGRARRRGAEPRITWAGPMPIWAKNRNRSKSYNQALAIWREIGNRQGEALARRSWAGSIPTLARNRRRWITSTRRLPIWRESGNRSGEALGAERYRQSVCRSGRGPAGARFLQPGIADLARSRQPPRRSHDVEQHGQGLSRPGTSGQGAGNRTTRRSPSGTK